MSAAPRPTPRAPPRRRVPSLLGRLPQSAGGPSRLQVVRPRRCAAAGAPPGPAPRPPAPQACSQKDEKSPTSLQPEGRKDQTNPLPPGPVFIERLTRGFASSNPISYRYDFGDCWDHSIQREQVLDLV